MFGFVGSTKPGAKLACFITSNAQAKDKKKIIKALKGSLYSSITHHAGT